jgi:hypothetical protein
MLPEEVKAVVIPLSAAAGVSTLSILVAVAIGLA